MGREGKLQMNTNAPTGNSLFFCQFISYSNGISCITGWSSSPIACLCKRVAMEVGNGGTYVSGFMDTGDSGERCDSSPALNYPDVLIPTKVPKESGETTTPREKEG